jgi:hypothetical protein
MLAMMKAASSELAIILIGIRNKWLIDSFAVAHIGPQNIFSQKFRAMRHTQNSFYKADHQRSGGIEADHDSDGHGNEEYGKEEVCEH